MAAIPWGFVTVSYRASLKEGDWAALPNVHAIDLTYGLAPTIDRATLEYNFGTIDGAYRTRLDLKGQFVRIEVNVPVYDGGELVYDEGEIVYDTSHDWVGYVLSEETRRWAQEDSGGSQRLRGGDQTFGVVGLEWFLAVETINHSIVYPAARIDRVMGFNTGFGDGRDVEYAERGNKDTRGLAFAEDKDHCELWNALDIADYLLTNHQPKDSGGVNEPCDFVLDLGTLDYLQAFEPTVRVDGNSVWQALNQVIAQNRGLTWRTSFAYDGADPVVTLHISSMATASIALPGGGSLAAAAEIITIDGMNDILGEPVIQRDLAREYDQVVCRGAQRRFVFTAGMDDILEKSWSDADEAAYNLAASDADPLVNDLFRQRNQFERVYTCYNVRTDWNLEVAEGVFACPRIEQSTGSIIGADRCHVPSLRLLPVMPLKVGWDYTDATAPDDTDPTNIRPEFQRPFCVIDVGDSDWRFTHRLNKDDGLSGDTLTSYYMHVLSGTAGFQLTPGGKLPHVIASAAFDPETDSVSEVEPELDFNDLQATVCGEADAYCEGVWPAAAPASKPLRKLYFSIGERARFDWLAANTVLDVNEDGTLQTCTTAGALRDDRLLCQNYARIAYDWYGQDRAQVQIQYKTIDSVPNLGALITTIGTAEALETVNAVVSQITLNLNRGTATLLAGFAELDLAEL